MSTYSDDNQGVTFFEVTRETLTFAECYDKIRAIYADMYNVLENIAKCQAIARYLSIYFASEDRDDLYEGFMRLICVLHDNISRETSLEQKDLTLVKQVFESFCIHLTLLPTEEKDALIGNISVEKNERIIQQTLSLLAKFKVKHLERINQIFHLKDARMVNILHQTIDSILRLNDLPKAISWMEFFNARDHFPFEDIVCRLFIDNQTTLVEPFVGEEIYRKKALIIYLDKLTGYHVRGMKEGCSELEEKVLLDYKKISKATAKFMRLWPTLEVEIPNTMFLRCRERLMYHHYRWQNNECTLINFEEIALHEMKESERVRDFYLNFLCRQGLQRNALIFVAFLDLKLKEYPTVLRDYYYQYPEVDAEVRRKVKVELEKREQNQKIEDETECFLRLAGAQQGPRIVLVDTYTGLRKVIEALKDEVVIGIDAEWRMNPTSTVELVALLQIATSKAIFLVDVFVLERMLSEDQWREFLEALLCTNTRKIGYDFRNDMRVLTSTFPFMESMKTEIKNVVCLYRLFSQVILIADANAIIFDSKPPVNLGLADVSKFFMDLDMNKAERVSNWSQRPLRYEQKQYAALDAYCLTKIFKKVANKLAKFEDSQMIADLQKGAVMTFEPEKEHKFTVNNCVYVPKEDEENFMLKVQENATKMKARMGISNGPPEFKSIDDIKFVVDSMLFGLGKRLRRCGFDTRMIGDRNKLINFCEQNPEFIALSTGKGFKQIEIQLPRRVLNVPSSTIGSQHASELVSYVMRELNILINPEDMWTRCVDCNKRSFVRVPALIIQVLFYRNVLHKGADWLEITEEDEQNAIRKLCANSLTTISSSSETLNEEYVKLRQEMGEEEYVLFVNDVYAIGECKECSVDILNRLMLAETRGSPVQVHAGLKLKKVFFDEPGAYLFYVCAECGKVQYTTAPE